MNAAPRLAKKLVERESTSGLVPQLVLLVESPREDVTGKALELTLHSKLSVRERLSRVFRGMESLRPSSISLAMSRRCIDVRQLMLCHQHTLQILVRLQSQGRDTG